jgi:hypothetical protein
MVFVFPSYSGEVPQRGAAKLKNGVRLCCSMCENAHCKWQMLRLAASWPEEIPQDQTHQRQQHYNNHPKQFLLIRSAALKNIDNRPDITREYQKAPEAVSIVHHFHFLSMQVNGDDSWLFRGVIAAGPAPDVS